MVRGNQVEDGQVRLTRLSQFLEKNCVGEIITKQRVYVCDYSLGRKRNIL